MARLRAELVVVVDQAVGELEDLGSGGEVGCDCQAAFAAKVVDLEKRLLEGARLAREKREKARIAATAEADRERLREQHFMRCPKCGHEMKEEELEGIKIDRCSFCEGIFFDAGELDQLYLRRQEDRRSFFRKLVGI